MTFKIVTDSDFVSRCAHTLTCSLLDDAQKLNVIRAAYREMAWPEIPRTTYDELLLKVIYENKIK